MLVCKGCGHSPMTVDSSTKNPSCVICIGFSPDNGVMIEVPDPEIFRCDECNRVFQTQDILKKWYKIPFATSEGTFYCGCNGWD